jgi:hypothetical protein
MRTIQNKTRRPLRIPLPGGKFLHLAPGKTGQIADRAVERPAFKKLIDAGEIELHGEGEHGSAGHARAGSITSSTHGHPQTTVVLPKGNR